MSNAVIGVNKSSQMEDSRKGCLGCLTFIGILMVFISCSTFFLSGKAPQKQVKIKESAPLPSLNINDSKQIISDEQVGRTIAKIMCGDKTLQDAVDYLNQMGVPVEKIKNIQAFPGVHRGYLEEKGSRNC